LGCESHIVRTTVYLPEYLHQRGKQLKINFSKEFVEYLKTRLYDDDLYNLEIQLDEAKEHVKKATAELSFWQNKVAELDVRIVKEIFYRVKNNNFTFDMFEKLRRGEPVF